MRKYGYIISTIIDKEGQIVKTFFIKRKLEHKEGIRLPIKPLTRLKQYLQKSWIPFMRKEPWDKDDSAERRHPIAAQ